jgi:DNA-binding PadR family transcriptional regulator
MPRRKHGTILPLEEAILEHGVTNEPFYGFALARALSGGGSALTAHGTLYKALTRMAAAGLIEATWEDAEVAEAEGRPRRRLYRVTGDGARALATARATERPATSTKVALA